MKLTVRETVIFGMLGAVMFVSKILMEFLPNIHLLAVLTVAYTVVYRKKALFPIYTYVLLNGVYAGFTMWWVPYLYIWAVLWLVTMLLPKKMGEKTSIAVYMAICTLHGLCFGILYAPAQMLMYGFGFKQIVAWVIAGFPYDAIHGAGNLILSVLVVPIATLLKRLEKT